MTETNSFTTALKAEVELIESIHAQITNTSLVSDEGTQMYWGGLSLMLEQRRVGLQSLLDAAATR